MKKRPLRWEVEYAVGKVDDPQHGQIIVEANDVAEAISQAKHRAGIRPQDIVRVELTDL